jgi:Nif-specific regulatory protein
VEIRALAPATELSFIERASFNMARQYGLADGDDVAIDELMFQIPMSEEAPASVPVEPDETTNPQSGVVPAPDAPLARETATLLRVSEISRTVQSLYLERSGRQRCTLERHLFELVFELIPSRRGVLVVVEGDGPSLLASYDAESGKCRVKIPGPMLEDVLQNPATRTGVTDGSAWIASPLMVSGRVLGLLCLGSGLHPREFRDDDEHMITVLCELLALALENARDLYSLRTENERLRAGRGAGTLMIGESAGMTALYRSIAKVARGNSTVLICGESGTGKELVAQSIHRSSPRASRPFITINCAAIAENLLESEFFGHEKGSFTGAHVQRKGKLELADGGTVFLDEIGELAPALQAKLLRVLQEHKFDRVGGDRPIRVDIRVIAATNRDLERAIAQGTFREDLFYRLNVVPLRIPPLRQRREDISPLANWFVRKFSEQTGRNVTGLSREARAILTTYDWPGNVRELQNVIERAVVMGSTDVISPDDLSDLLPDIEAPEAEESGGFHDAVRQTRRRLIASALERAGGNVTEAARGLKLHPNYLHRLMTTLGLREE